MLQTTLLSCFATDLSLMIVLSCLFETGYYEIATIVAVVAVAAAAVVIAVAVAAAVAVVVAFAYYDQKFK